METAFAESFEHERVRRHPRRVVQVHLVQCEPQVSPEPPIQVGIDDTAISDEVGHDAGALHVVEAEMEIPEHGHPGKGEEADVEGGDVGAEPGANHVQEFPLQALHLEGGSVGEQQQVPQKVAEVFPPETHVP